MKTSFALASAILAATSYAQVTVNGSSNVTCVTPGNYCAGQFIIHCYGTSGYVGNCQDNLDNFSATCVQTNTTSADGICCIPGVNCPGYPIANSTTTTSTVTSTTSTALATSSSIDYFFNTSSSVILVPVTPITSSSISYVTSSVAPFANATTTTTTTSAVVGPTGISISTPITPTFPIGSSTPLETSTLATSTLATSVLATSTLATSTLATSTLATSTLAAGTSTITGTITSTATIGGSGSGSGSGSTTTGTAVVTASQISDGQVQATSAGAAPTTSTVAPYKGAAANVHAGGIVGGLAVVLGAMLV